MHPYDRNVKGGTSHQLKNTGKKIATAEATAIKTPMISIKRNTFQSLSYNFGFLISIITEVTVEIPIMRNPIIKMICNFSIFFSLTCITPRLGAEKTTWVLFILAIITQNTWKIKKKKGL